MTESRTWLERLSNRIYGIPAVTQLWARRAAQGTAGAPGEGEPIPFRRLRKPLSRCRVALLTTGGIHLPGQAPFDMQDPDGDPSYRVIPGEIPSDGLTITHKYYDHTDADADVNVIFPLTHVRDLVQQGVLGDVAPRHYGLMGHIQGKHVTTLVGKTAPEIAAKMRADGVDFAFLTPA